MIPVHLDGFGPADDPRTRLRVVPGSEIDLSAAARAVADFLRAMGHDPTCNELEDTPHRVASAMAATLTPEPFTMTTFANDGDYDEMIVVRDIAFQSLCACHLLPFDGTANLAYIPDQRLVGLSKLVRVVDGFARALQTPQRLTREVADALESALHPRGVGVVIRATLPCGATGDGGTTSITTAIRGLLSDDLATRDEFTRLTQAR